MNQYNEKGQREGYWEYCYSNGKPSYKGYFINDKLNGYYEGYYDGKINYKIYFI